MAKPLNPAVKAMVFDLDGTLADTLPQLRWAINSMLFELGYVEEKFIDEDTMASYVGNGAQLLIARALLGRKHITAEMVDKDLMQRAQQLFASFYQRTLNYGVSLYPMVAKTLEYCRHEKQMSLAVLTNKPHRFVESLLDILNIKEHFQFILGSEVLDVKKPHSKTLNYVMDKMDVTAAETLMVGDSITDFQTAQNCQVRSCIFTFGYHGNDDVHSFGADYVFDSWQELYDLISNN